MKRETKVKRTALLTVAVSLLLSTTSLAGWEQEDSGKWWYRYDDGNYPKNEWVWIDDDEDGTAECYYFDIQGYMASSIVIDGYNVNGSGQWVIGNIVQTKEVSTPGIVDDASELLNSDTSIPLNTNFETTRNVVDHGYTFNSTVWNKEYANLLNMTINELIQTFGFCNTSIGTTGSCSAYYFICGNRVQLTISNETKRVTGVTCYTGNAAMLNTEDSNYSEMDAFANAVGQTGNPGSTVRVYQAGTNASIYYSVNVINGSLGSVGKYYIL